MPWLWPRIHHCLCPGLLFTIACKKDCQLFLKSLGIAICFRDGLNCTPYRCRPHSDHSGHTNLAPATYPSVRVKTLGRHTLPRWTAPLIYTCLSARVGGTTPYTVIQWRTEGGAVFTRPPPEILKALQKKSCQTQPDCENC